VAGGYRWVILAVGAWAQAAAAAFYVGVAAIAPALRAEYGLSLTGLGLVLAAPSLGLVCTLVAWGLATDRVGERPVLMLSLGGAAAVLAVAPLTHSAPALFAVLLLAAAAVAGVNSASGRAVLDWFPTNGRGFAMAVRQSAVPLGAALSAAVLPALVAGHGLGSAFGVLAADALVAAGAVALWIRPFASRRAPTAQPAAPPGPVAKRGRLIADSAPLRPLTAPPGQVAKRPQAKLLVMLRDPNLRRISAAGSLLLFPQVAVTVFGVELLHGRGGYPATTAAAIIGLTQVIGGGLRLLAGWWSDRIGDRLRPMRLIALGLAVAFAGLGALLLAPGAPLGPLLFAVGPFAICWNALAFLAAGELAPPGQAGGFIGVQNTALFATGTLAATLIGFTADHAGWPLTIGLLALPAAGAAALLAVPAAGAAGRPRPARTGLLPPPG
jgi:MFS family permease